MSKALSREDVAQMNFDEGHRDTHERIAQRNARVGQSARIDDDETGAVASGCVNAFNQNMLGVALQGRQAVPAPRADSASRPSMSCSVSLPYTAGSRVPSRFKFGPFSSRICAIPDRSR